MFSSIFTGDFTLGQFLVAILVSLVLGFLISLFYMYKNTHTKSLALSLILIPAIETVVIMMVNGNLGAGIAVAGSFSLIRFRSVKGNAKELVCIFLSMAVGIICGTGYVALACVFTLLLLVVSFLLTVTNFGEHHKERYLKIVCPESLNYEDAFIDILKTYTSSYELLNVKTINLGSLYKVDYRVSLKDESTIKKMLDEIRVRNSNLEVSLGVVSGEREELWRLKNSRCYLL